MKPKALDRCGLASHQLGLCFFWGSMATRHILQSCLPCRHLPVFYHVGLTAETTEPPDESEG